MKKKIMKFVKLEKLNFILSICVAFCISNLLFADDDLPKDLQQIRQYFNNPPAITNLTFVLTNYTSPYAFRDMNAVRKAMSVFGFDPTKPTVNYCGYSYDPALPGLVYRELPAEAFKDHALHDTSILTNYYEPIYYFWGRSNHTWWSVMPSKYVGLSFDVLTNSIDGSKWWDTNQTERSFIFRDSIYTDASVFHHLGYGWFETNSWKIRKKDLTNFYEWRATSIPRGKLVGNLWRTNEAWMMNLIDAKGKASQWTRLIWDDEAQMPKQFFAVNLFKDEDGNDHEGIYQSFTKVDSPMIWWKDYPEAFGFSYHTNAGIRYANSITFFTTNGEQISMPVGRSRFDKDDFRPLFSSGFLQFILFVFTFGCIGFFLWRRARS